MGYDAGLAEQVRKFWPRGEGYDERLMFGGRAFFLNGHICVALWNDSLIVRLGLEEWEGALREPYVKEFDVTGRVMRGWVMVLPEGLEGEDLVGDWVGRSLEYVRGLPKKTGGKPRRTGGKKPRPRGGSGGRFGGRG